jgi:hypothetical protein
MKENIPVILFAYARPDHLRQTLQCLRQNKVPLIIAFSDAARSSIDEERVELVRKQLHEIDWCETRIIERRKNLGLGKSIISGVTEALMEFEIVIVFEDDLICVPGTYNYLCSALRHYQTNTNVMSVTGWNHPELIPSDIEDQPYFDGRSDCLVWGTWRRVWQEMGSDSKSLLKSCEAQGIDIYRYGADLVDMAEIEIMKNIWAVRFLFLHILNKGLCLRPPWSMVEHIGHGSLATNASDWEKWKNPPLKQAPPIPQEWPAPIEHPQCPTLNQKAFGSRPTLLRQIFRKFRLSTKKMTAKLANLDSRKK